MIRRIKGAKYLVKPTDPLQIDRDRSVPGLLDKMEKISFQGRNLAMAHQIWLQMLQENAVVLMGVGGVLALGCTVGQGLTGIATLALGSFVAVGGIVIGGILGVRYLEEGSLGGAIRAMLARS